MFSSSFPRRCNQGRRWLQQESRAITAERAFSRYSIIAAFGLAVLGIAASLGSNASVLTAGHTAVGVEIPIAGDLDQQLAQKYFLLPTNQIDSDASAPAPEPDQPEATTEGPIEQIIQIQKGDTLMSVLTDAGIKKTEAHAAIVALSDVFSPRQLKPGQPIKLTLAPNAQDDGQTDSSAQPNLQLVALSLQPSVSRSIELTRGLDGVFTAQSTDVPLHRQMARAAGVIQSSLFEAGQASGVPIEVMTRSHPRLQLRRRFPARNPARRQVRGALRALCRQRRASGKDRRRRSSPRSP